LRNPGELVGFGVPLGLGGDGGATKHGRAPVIESDGVVGEPGAEGLASTGGDGLRETAFELEQEQGARGEGRLRERVGVGAGELCQRVQSWRSWIGDRTALCGQRKNQDSAEEEEEQGRAVHGEYAISRRVGSLKVTFVWKTDILRT
jgi:hypothetical protein